MGIKALQLSGEPRLSNAAAGSRGMLACAFSGGTGSGVPGPLDGLSGCHVEVLGLDHIYLAVSDMERAERFYDQVMRALGFRKGDRSIAGEPHAHYFNRSIQVTIRLARSKNAHDPYAPGLHHLCLQLPSRSAVDQAASTLAGLGIQSSKPKLYPEYNPDYYATFFTDPDGLRFELVARTRDREAIVQHWDEFRSFLNPLTDLRSRQN
jgi:catechol 2,3-dioxygenase-like lactoylglutathione lyase family enzyme